MSAIGIERTINSNGANFTLSEPLFRVSVPAIDERAIVVDCIKPLSIAAPGAGRRSFNISKGELLQ
jgi:hypothetical protein